MRNSLPVRCALTGAAMIVFLAMPSLAQTCENQLVAKSPYLCDFKFMTGETFQECLYFTTPHPDESSSFGVYINGLDWLVCNCAAAGNMDSTQFDATTSFTCLTQEDGNVYTYAFSGKTADGGRKISKGQTFSEFGELYIYSCRQDVQTCGLALQTPAQPSHWGAHKKN